MPHRIYQTIFAHSVRSAQKTEDVFKMLYTVLSVIRVSSLVQDSGTQMIGLPPGLLYVKENDLNLFRAKILEKIFHALCHYLYP